MAPDAEPDVPVERVNRLANPGSELGETWRRPAGWVNHQWSRAGERVYESDATFAAREGRYALKIWGHYSGGVVPNDSEHSSVVTDLTPSDEHVFSAHGFTHADAQISGGNQVLLFVRYLDSAGSVLAQSTSAAFTAESAPGV